MSNPLPPFRPVALVVMICSLIAVMALHPTASQARPAIEAAATSAQAGTDRTDAAQRSQSEGTTDPQAAYYASYGPGEPVTTATGTGGTSDDTPLLPIAIAGAAVLLLAAGTAHAGRRRVAHRHAHMPA